MEVLKNSSEIHYNNNILLFQTEHYKLHTLKIPTDSKQLGIILRSSCHMLVKSAVYKQVNYNVDIDEKSAHDLFIQHSAK